MDQANDELFPGATLSVDQHRRIQRRHASRKLEHLLHGCTARDEVLGGGVARNAFAQQIQLALTLRHVPLTALEFLQALVNSFPDVFDLLPQIRALKVDAKRLERVAPTRRVLSNDRALRGALRQTLAFAEVNLLAETRAHVPARIARQRPAHRHFALAIVVYVLFGRVGIVPEHFLLESAGCGIVFDLGDFGSDDSFKPVKHGTCPEAFQRVCPFRAFAQAHGIVVPVCVSKPQHQASRRLESQRVDEFLAQETHRSGAQNDDALLMEADDPLIRAEIEQRGEVEVLEIQRSRVRQSFHINLRVHSIDTQEMDPSFIGLANAGHVHRRECFTLKTNDAVPRPVGRAG